MRQSSTRINWKQWTGVDQILWCDSTVNIYSGEDFIRQKDIEDYYKDRCAVMDITFDQGDTAKKTSRAIDEMKAITGDMILCGNGCTEQIPDGKCESEMNLILTVAVIMIFAVLCISTTAWSEPFLFCWLWVGYFAEPGHEYFYRDSLVPHQ